MRRRQSESDKKEGGIDRYKYNDGSKKKREWKEMAAMEEKRDNRGQGEGKASEPMRSAQNAAQTLSPVSQRAGPQSIRDSTLQKDLAGEKHPTTQISKSGRQKSPSYSESLGLSAFFSRRTYTNLLVQMAEHGRQRCGRSRRNEL